MPHSGSVLGQFWISSGSVPQTYNSTTGLITGAPDPPAPGPHPQQRARRGQWHDSPQACSTGGAFDFLPRQPPVPPPPPSPQPQRPQNHCCRFQGPCPQVCDPRAHSPSPLALGPQMVVGAPGSHGEHHPLGTCASGSLRRLAHGREPQNGPTHPPHPPQPLPFVDLPRPPGPPWKRVCGTPTQAHVGGQQARCSVADRSGHLGSFHSGQPGRLCRLHPWGQE